MVDGRADDTLLHTVDLAHSARNRCSAEHKIVYMDHELQASLIEEKTIRDSADIGLKQGEFEVYFQPKVNIVNDQVIGAEALVRWKHHELGFLSPAEFIPILEQSGFIIEIDFYVLEQACKLVRRWLDSGYEPIVISVNQSRVHFLLKDYIDRLKKMMTRYHIPAGYIELEITETLFGQEAISNNIIREMRALGFLISIDDFGSGYSSLYLLHQISVDILKIDKGLLDEGEKYEKMRNIIKRIVQIAVDLDIHIICEGVETQEQVEFLVGIGCEYAQGYLFSKPLPLSAFEEFLENNRKCNS